MEDITYQAIVGATVAEAVIRILWAVLGGLLTAIGFWGLRKRIAALERKEAQPPVQILNVVTSGKELEPDAIRAALREELRGRDANQVDNLVETVNQLTQHPLGDGHRYATLPDGTNIVMMADGSVRLVLPVRISAHFKARSPSTHATVEGQFVDPEPARPEGIGSASFEAPPPAKLTRTDEKP